MYMPIRVALLASNMIRIDASCVKGTEIFVHSYVSHLAKRILQEKLPIQLTVFASGDSVFPESVRVVSVANRASLDDPEIGMDRYKQFELALISQAVAMQNQFDLFHVNLSNGEYALPFLKYVKKPVIITMHGGDETAYSPSLFQLYRDLPNVWFVSISENQKKRLPDLHYIQRIYHGVDLQEFPFSEAGGEPIFWAGRGIPEKGLGDAFEVIRVVKKPAMIYPILKLEHLEWLKTEILSKRTAIRESTELNMDFDLPRKELARKYGISKLFLFPVRWDEPFGLVMAESLASGTPVVAYRRGSVPEIVEDGVTGYIIPQDDYGSGMGGVSGLIRAVRQIYDLPSEAYRAMRRASRKRAEQFFSVDRMISEYIDLYRKITM